MRDKYVQRDWQPHERPTLPGSASTPLHPTRRRIQYGLVGVVVALTGGLSNALVTANLTYLQGTLGAYATEMAWLPAAYVMTNMSANLLLVKFRQQFGLRRFTEIFLALYALIAFAHLFVHSLGSAITVRAAHGLVGAALSSLGLYYVIQAFPTKYRLKAVVLGLGMTQLALPLARVFSTDLLEFGEWQGLYLFECGLAVFALACVLALKLPPSDRYRVFEPLDFLTFSLFAAGAAGLAAVLSLGRLLWWTSTPWLGVVLAASIVLLCTAAWIEHNRRNPMINTRWLASADMLRLGLAILLIRLVLSEQSTGAIGFFQTLGLANTQLQTLFALMLLGAVVGVAASAWLINPARVAEHLIIAVAAICTGCFMDADATSLTRPEQMYASQFLLAFGSTFFIGPAMVAGIGRVIAQPGNLISFIVLFGMAQNMGGLLGSALLGTVQVVREKYHSSQLVEHLVLTDPQVAARVQAYASLYGRSIGDPALRQAQGVRTLGTVATREANVLAYNDVFLLIGCIAIATGVWILSVLVWRRYLRPSVSPSPPAPTARP
ncbi:MULTISPECIES: MFS transporter [Xanthomonas]|uniref:MFS transporter n=2 Tax=Xanthomonas TaxID=338 RepID=A0A7Z7J556_XANCH|nr:MULTISPECIES: MFS transporter [Xanthomonas]MEE5091784.1 MFS transporter [Xanthomonas euvesicatoria]ATS37646.1 MFS transporter [Xanthomonas citri pv. phaseoli var. fuscans]ATS43546.1 MFS transporter [Xanthomonas citri pv. phaseoli var. fuscans]ATS45648.1 MFS transporter [Xanthomonas citri pv. phaseoli var. fuscans]ATS84088.1 MFS transporter [Xanthomonas citri pv. phaseoli var. fuscans]